MFKKLLELIQKIIFTPHKFKDSPALKVPTLFILAVVSVIFLIIGIILLILQNWNYAQLFLIATGIGVVLIGIKVMFYRNVN